MRCREIEKYLPLYPEETDPMVTTGIDHHLRGCKSCMMIWENLRRYASYAANEAAPEIPRTFNASVLEKLTRGKQSSSAWHPLVRYVAVFGTVAASIIIALVLWPAKDRHHTVYEVNFALREEKRGKGPSELVNFDKIHERATTLLQETESTIEERANNAITGYYDYLIVSVPRAELPVFMKKLENLLAVPLILPGIETNREGRLFFKLYFDMINVTSGNFDGDSYADLLVQFLSGKHKGKWIVLSNDRTGAYTKGHRIHMEKDDEEYLGDFWMLSGDFNGDGYDDICLYDYSTGGGLTLRILLNDKASGYTEHADFFSTLQVPKTGEFVKMLAGDADGNGCDDLLWVTRDRGVVTVTALNIQKSFTGLELPGFDPSMSRIFAGDFNRDHFTDLCVKYMEGDSAGDTYIFANDKQFNFMQPIFYNKSFVGDYLFWTGDHDADGYDDIYVKSGGPFISGTWYITVTDSTVRSRKIDVINVQFPPVIQ